jgi:conjugal transfer pilus assembly protein TraV
LHDQSYLYVVANSGRWAIEHSQRKIVDRYRPTFLKPGTTGKAVQKPLPQTQRPMLPLGGPTLPGNQAIGPTGPDAFAGDRE